MDTQVILYKISQMLWHLVMPTLVLALVQFTWMMLAAVAEKIVSLTAHMSLIDTSGVSMAT